MRITLLLASTLWLAGAAINDARGGLLRNLQSSPSDGRLILPGLYESVTLSTGPGGCSETQEAVLDIYPSADTNNAAGAPTVLHLPGGAYMNLISDTVDSAGAQYMDANYTVAVLYYRLPRSATTTSWLVCSDPWEAIEDVSAAIQHLKTNAVEYNIDPNRIVLSGFSAGGHLGALYSATCEQRGSCPRAQVLHFPFLEKGSQIFCSDVGSAFSNLQEYDDCFPTALVDAASPPTVLYHANGDGIVPTSQMTDFVAALEGQDISYEYYDVPTGGHYLVPFSQVAAVSDGVLNADGTYASLIDRALSLPTPNCVRCDDIPTQWMVDNDRVCDNADWHINNKCTYDTFWTSEGYCRASCFEAGRGYPNETCCPAKTLPECTECTNDPTGWMERNGKTCGTSPSSIDTKCRDDSWWVTNSYCQQSCFDAGRGYDGINCCLFE